jgi:hypothetical protein
MKERARLVSEKALLLKYVFVVGECGGGAGVVCKVWAVCISQISDFLMTIPTNNEKQIK